MNKHDRNKHRKKKTTFVCSSFFNEIILEQPWTLIILPISWSLVKFNHIVRKMNMAYTFLFNIFSIELLVGWLRYPLKMVSFWKIPLWFISQVYVCQNQLNVTFRIFLFSRCKNESQYFWFIVLATQKYFLKPIAFHFRFNKTALTLC